MDRGDRFKEVGSLRNGHIEDFGNVFALIFDLKSFPVVPRAMTDFTRDIHVGEEIHFNLDCPVAPTCFAPTAFNIE